MHCCRDLEKLETKLKADRAKLERERQRLDNIRGDQMDAVMSKVGICCCCLRCSSGSYGLRLGHSSSNCSDCCRVLYVPSCTQVSRLIQTPSARWLVLSGLAMQQQTDDLTNAWEDLEGLADAKAEHEDKLAAARGGVENAKEAVAAVPQPAEVRAPIENAVGSIWPACLA